MESRDLILLFFIIYSIITSLIFIYIWDKTRRISESKSEYIDELLYEIGKLRVDKKRKKWYLILEEDLWKSY